MEDEGLIETRKKEINNIINIIGNNGEQIDVFKLHGVLYIGNQKKGVWDITQRYIRLSEKILPMSVEDFDDCETSDEIRNRFAELLDEAITEKLL